MARRRSREESSGGGLPGWLIWVGVLIGINVASWAFDWGWYFY